MKIFPCSFLLGEYSQQRFLTLFTDFSVFKHYFYFRDNYFSAMRPNNFKFNLVWPNRLVRIELININALEITAGKATGRRKLTPMMQCT